MIRLYRVNHIPKKKKIFLSKKQWVDGKLSKQQHCTCMYGEDSLHRRYKTGLTPSVSSRDREYRNNGPNLMLTTRC